MTVVDASALAAVVFLEEQADTVRAVIDGQDLAAPRLLPFELANIARNKVHRRPDAFPIPDRSGDGEKDRLISRINAESRARAPRPEPRVPSASR